MTRRTSEDATPQVHADVLTMQRRLNPLEAAAATAVIVLCLVALAMMTGVLKTPLGLPASQPEPSGTASHVMAGRLVKQRAPTQPPGISDNRQILNATEATHALSALPRLPESNAMEEIVPAENLPLLTAGHIPSENTTVQIAANTPTTENNASDALQKRRVKVRKNRHDANFRSKKLAASGVTHGKTRQQVTAELMRAQRDGSYTVTAETYR